MGNPLPWVRWDCAALQSPKWLSTPYDERGIWSDMVRLAAKNGGIIEMTEAEIAFIIGPERGANSDLQPVMRTIERFIRNGALERTKHGFRVVKFSDYNPPTRFLSQAQRRVSIPDQPRLQGYDPEVRERTYGTNETDVRTAHVREAFHETPDGIAAMAELDRVPGYEPRDDDRGWLTDQRTRFPTIDMAEEIAKFASWTSGRRKPVKNYRLTLHNWFAKAVQIANEQTSRRRELPKVLPSVDLQLQRARSGLDPMTGTKL